MSMASWGGLCLLGAHPYPFTARSLCSGRLPTLQQAVAFPSAPLRPFTSTAGGASSAVIPVKSDAEYVSALNLAQENNGVAVVYFTAKCCGPCCVSGRALVGSRLHANVFRTSHCQDMESNPFKVKWRLHASLSKTEDEFSSKQAEWRHKGPSFQEKMTDVIQSYPWGALCRRFLERTLDLVWIPAKWLAIPVFVLSTVNEFLYTLIMKKDICIPLGILVGFLLAKVVGGAAVDVMNESQQDGRAAWPLMLLGLFFLLLKLSSPYLPSWSAVFIPHMANAGLLKTFFQYRELSQPSLF